MWLLILLLLIGNTGNVFADSFRRGSGLSQGEQVMDKYPIRFHEVDANPAAPPTDEIRIFAKDNAGTTTIYTIDSAGTVTIIGSSGSGDTTSVGDCASGACFDGTQGTVLTFYNSGGNGTITYDGTSIIFSKPIQGPASNTPQLNYFPTQTSDTHWITGISGDGGNDNDDNWVLSEGTTLGSSNRISCAPGGICTIGTLATSSVAYNATTWNASLNAPTRDDVRDQFELIAPGSVTVPLYFQRTLLPQGAVLDDGAPPAMTVLESSGTGTARFYSLDFNKDTLQTVYYLIQVPSDMTSGNWIFDIQWIANATANAAIWGVQVQAITPSDADTPLEHAFATATTTTTTVNATEAYRLNTTQISVSNLDSVAAGDLVIVKLYRDAAQGGDTLAVDARFLDMRIRIPRA